MTYLNPIARLSGADNSGGIVDIKVARIADILTMPVAKQGIYFEEVAFITGSGWITWLVTQGTAGFTGRSKESMEGPYKDGNLSFSIPKDKPEVFEMLKKAEQDEFIVMFRDANNRRKIFGTPEAPVNFKFDHATGRRTSNMNAYDCDFYTEGVDNIAFYNEDLGVTPGTGALPALVTNYRNDIVAVLYPGDQLKIDSPYLWEAYIL